MKNLVFISFILVCFVACKKDDLKPKPSSYTYNDTTYYVTGTPGIFNQYLFCLYPYKSLIIDATVNDSSATYLWYPGGETTPTIEVHEQTNGLHVDIFTDTLTQIFIAVDNCFPDVYVPSSFSPDGDGKNDHWRPVVEDWANHGITYFYYEIRDTEGAKLFSTDDRASQGWDGKYNGLTMTAGFYMYYINYSTLTTENNILTGSLELIR